MSHLNNGISLETIGVNIQDFLQVFQVSGIGKIEDNLTSADPLSYTTTIMLSRVSDTPGDEKSKYTYHEYTNFCTEPD